MYKFKVFKYERVAKVYKFKVFEYELVAHLLVWPAACQPSTCEGPRGYRGTSLIRNRRPLGPCSRTMPRVLGGGAVSYERGSPAWKALNIQRLSRKWEHESLACRGELSPASTLPPLPPEPPLTLGPQSATHHEKIQG